MLGLSHWADMVEEEGEELISLPTPGKLSPKEPTFMPKGSDIINTSSLPLTGPQAQDLSNRSQGKKYL